MKTSLLKEVGKHLESRRMSKRLRLVAAGMAAIVVIATAYALVLPAITMGRETYCGKEEHEHSEECYRQVLVCEQSELSRSQRVLDCPLQQHVHVNACRDGNGSLICGYADFVVHSHAENCYDSNGNLVCGLPEIREHAHTSGCYTENRILICGQQEFEGHMHTDACYTERETGNFVCGLAEDENHTHTDECKEKVTELSCGLQESEGHYHSDGCYETVRNYTCGKDEIILHKHNANCYGIGENGQQQRICGMTEVLEHVHDDNCFVENTAEESAHEHTAECYANECICTREEHEHTDICFENPEEVQKESEDEEENSDGSNDIGNTDDTYGTDNVDDGDDADKAQSSGNEEDADNTDDMQNTDDADDMQASDGSDDTNADNAGDVDGEQNADDTEKDKSGLDVQCGMEEHIHSENCYNARGDMVCEQEEHVHELSCYLDDARAEVENVIAMMNALPDAAELEARMGEYGDTEEGEEYYLALVKQAAEAYDAYESLNGELKRFIDTGAEKFQIMKSLAEAYNPMPLTIEYSSDLAEFSPVVTIKDDKGEEIGPGGTVTIGNSYSIDLEFRETSEKQFKYVEEGAENAGCLTYQIPLGFEVKPVSNAQLKAETGEILGSYSITEEGLLTVKFLNVDGDGNPTDENFIDTTQGAWVRLHFDAIARRSGDGSETVIKWGGDAETTYKTDYSARAGVKKNVVEYDSATHTVRYKVEITNENGLIKNGTLTDEMDPNLSYVDGSMQVTDKDGKSVEGWQVTPTDTGFVLNGLPEMVKGDKLIVTYEAKVDDSVYAGDNVKYIANNTATFKGKNLKDEDIPEVFDKSEATIDSNLIRKSGEIVKITDENGNEVSVIKWTVIVGDGSSTLGGSAIEIEDELVGNQEFYDLDGTLGFVAKLENFGVMELDKSLVTYRFDSGNEKKVYFTLPTKQKVYDRYGKEYSLSSANLCDYTMAMLTYYTRYTTGGESSTDIFENNAKVKIDGNGYETTAKVDIVGTAPRIEKKVTGNDSEKIEFTVTMSVPGALYGQPFFIQDRAVFWNAYGVKGSTYSVDTDIKIESIKCIGKSGRAYTFKEYGSEGADSANVTYILANVPEIGNLGDREIAFNATPENLEESRWNIAEDSTLTIVYSIPKSAKAGQGETVEEFDSTLEDVLSDPRNELHNIAFIYYGKDFKQSVYAEAQYKEQTYFKKEGHINYNDDGPDTVDYTVVFKNYNDAGNRKTSLILPKGVTGVGFRDEYNSKYLTFDTSRQLVVTVYNPEKETQVWGRFVYQGNPDSDRDGVMYVSAADFVRMNADSGLPINQLYSNLAEWLKDGLPKAYEKDGYIAGTAPGVYEFAYTMQVNEEAVKEANLSIVPLNNTADIVYDGGNIGKVTNKLQYDTGLIGKSAKQLCTDDGSTTDTLEFTIELNKGKSDLVKNKENYQVIDKMENLRFYLSTIKVEKNVGSAADPEWKELRMQLSQDKVTEDGDNYSFTFDNDVLEITVPDRQHVKITYQAQIINQQEQTANTASINGDTTMQDGTKAKYDVDTTSGNAGGGGFTLVKKNEYNGELLPNVKFALYTSKDPGKSIEPSSDEIARTKSVEITEEGNKRSLELYYIGEIETGSGGSTFVNQLNDVRIDDQALYMLVELEVPKGYMNPKKEVVFYFKDDWKEKVDSDKYDVKKVQNGYIFVTNEPYGIELPKTGGFGVIKYTLAGVVLMGMAGLMYIKRFRKRRGFLGH